MDDIRVITQIILADSDVQLTFAIAFVVLVPATLLWARRRRWGRFRTWSAVLAGGAFALVPATTLGRRGIDLALDRPCLLEPGWSLETPDSVLNFALFMPFAFFAVLASHRPLRVLGFVLVVSTLVETTQLITGLGVCQTSDVVRNTAGAGLAALAAVVPLAVARLLRGHQR